MKQKQLKRLKIQEGRLHEFDHQEKDHYEERKIGNEWYVKCWNGTTERWQVAVYSEASFKNYKAFNNLVEENEQRDNFLRDL